MPQDDNGDDLKKLTLDELHATRNHMLLWETIDAVKEAGEETGKSYFRTLSAVQDAIRDLENAELTKLLLELRSHESALRKRINDLKETRKNIGRVETFLNVANKVLQTVGTVLAKLA